ncbi:biotin transporter BioY [Phyllobacterium sp. TAF24]|uniref:biotin transporter BioY n=1 Tax=Phyllobacterium sp. TAF24 TaxID=3233068 RepID=UPI003F995EFF
MTINTSSPSTVLLGNLLNRRASLLQKAVLVMLASGALWASAKIQIPFYPVPLTMQTLMVIFIGMTMGVRLGPAAVALYLFEGAIGLPVFAGTPEKGIGLAYLLGPTGGYLLGYLPAAAICGWLAKRGWDRNPLWTALAMLAGNAMIYIPGLVWLGFAVGWDKPVLAWGLLPFLPGDVAKLVFAAVSLPLLKGYVGKSVRR